VSYTGYPIIEEATLTRSEAFRQPPKLRPGVAVVIHQPGRDLVVLRRSSDVIPRSDARHGTMLASWVDLSPHPMRLRYTVRCREEAFHFDVDVQVTCRVTDPGEVVRSHLVDVHEVVGPIVGGRVQSISRRFRIDQADEAQAECNRVLLALVSQPLAGGALVLDGAGALVAVDPAALELLRETELRRLGGQTQLVAAEQETEIQRIRGGTEFLKAQQQLATEQLRGQARIAAARQGTDLQHAEGATRKVAAQQETELARLKGETRLEEARQDHRLQEVLGETEKMTTEQEIERMKRWIDLYLPMIPDGDRPILAALVASDRTALAQVVNMIRGDRAAATADVVKVLGMLLEKADLDAVYDLGPVTRWVIKYFEQGERPALEAGQKPPVVIDSETAGGDEPPSPEPEDGGDGGDRGDGPPPSRLRRRTRG
jgi:hypothetical protein